MPLGDSLFVSDCRVVRGLDAMNSGSGGGQKKAPRFRRDLVASKERLWHTHMEPVEGFVGFGETSPRRVAEAKKGEQGQFGKEGCGGGPFQMPLHYPRYTRAQYEAMPEWELDCLLKTYGLTVAGGVDEKRSYAIGAFIWA
ncbi:uncharacterized protein A4U43_C01F3260 [Asparagus officinalis]|uniref:DUF7722 domain-containing protein n=1 Tax=Asparagus officinalis TaxID=4686 RepID=A0A5P1FLX4_ASPOF|nr:uncharacterized protein A4U43_C01F3260 [Asparagus officinalis]